MNSQDADVLDISYSNATQLHYGSILRTISSMSLGGKLKMVNFKKKLKLPNYLFYNYYVCL